jgi:hypothetical protein
MEVVHQDKQLSMAWCIECHRNPAPHIRPSEFVTKLDWTWPEGVDGAAEAQKLIDEKHINPMVNCAVCHR